MLLASVGQQATDIVLTGPLLLAGLIAVAAGLLSFISPCCLPLVPGYLSYLTGASAPAPGPTTRPAGEDGLGSAVTTLPRQQPVDAPRRGRALLGAVLFVLGFAALFTSYGAAFGGVGTVLLIHQEAVTRVLSAVTIVMGLAFASTPAAGVRRSRAGTRFSRRAIGPCPPGGRGGVGAVPAGRCGQRQHHLRSRRAAGGLAGEPATTDIAKAAGGARVCPVARTTG